MQPGLAELQIVLARVIAAAGLSRLCWDTQEHVSRLEQRDGTGAVSADNERPGVS